MGQAHVFESHASSLGFLLRLLRNQRGPSCNNHTGDVKSALRPHCSLLLLRAQPGPLRTPTDTRPARHRSPPVPTPPQPSLPTDTLTGTRGFTHVQSPGSPLAGTAPPYSSQPRPGRGLGVPAKHPHLWPHGPLHASPPHPLPQRPEVPGVRQFPGSSRPAHARPCPARQGQDLRGKKKIKIDRPAPGERTTSSRSWAGGSESHLPLTTRSPTFPPALLARPRECNAELFQEEMELRWGARPTGD